MKEKEHRHISTLRRELSEGRIDRREFLRYTTLLGVSATAAYAMAGKITGESLMPEAEAADMPIGGTLRIAMPVHQVETPHAFAFAEDSNICRAVCEYLSKTGADNVTRPYLLESWEASDDLSTWTLKIRTGVNWRSGRPFTAADVVWNINHVLQPETGSSVLGLMKAYMLDEFDSGQKDADGKVIMSTRLWDANAIEKVDDHTVRLNAKTPQVAVPEHFFHYPFAMLDPEENGKFGVGSNGTGPFELVQHDVGRKSVLKARKDYWGTGPYVDELQYIDLGDDPAAKVNALASQQVDGIFIATAQQLELLESLPNVQIYQVVTAETAVVRGKVSVKPFDDPRVRKAIRLAIDQKGVLDGALRGYGQVAEHHHVCKIHPDYAELPLMERDVAQAKKLLAEAGYPEGIEVEIATTNDPAWIPPAVQVMVEQWKEADIRVKINMMPGAQYWDVWDKVPFGYTNWYHRPLGFMVLALAYRSGVPWNESGYSNPEFDRLLTKAEGLVDVDARREVMRELEKIMQEDGPIAQPFWKSIITAYDNRVKGFKLHPTNYIFAEELGIES